MTGPATVTTAELRAGDVISTSDHILATVRFIDGHGRRNGTWVECVTDKGLTLQFAASGHLTVTRLSARAAVAAARGRPGSSHPA